MFLYGFICDSVSLNSLSFDKYEAESREESLGETSCCQKVKGMGFLLFGQCSIE